MSSMKDFFDLVAKDNNVKIELGTETIKALTALLAENGLKDDARKAIEEVTAKVAEAHGFDFNAPDELSDEELDAVAGGDQGPCYSCISGECGNCQHVGVNN